MFRLIESGAGYIVFNMTRKERQGRHTLGAGVRAPAASRAAGGGRGDGERVVLARD
jgi:hypothetical protein